MKIKIHHIILLVAWLLITGLGIYLTFMRQPEQLEVLQKAEQVAQMKNAELTSLQTEQVNMLHLTEEMVRKWEARYKIFPDSLAGAEVIAHLNTLTQTGFENFDVTYNGVARTPDFSYYTFSITGRGYYKDLYRFIWHIENNRTFYRVDDLSLDHLDLVKEDPESGKERLEVMVSFTLSLSAYFDSIEGASANDEGFGLRAEGAVPVGRQGGLPPVPAALLPAAQPPINPFFPVIMEEIPPNTYGLIDIEQATLVSIVGTKAIFRDAEGFRTAGVGDSVYLGEILSVDPVDGLVVVRLNKGGIIDEVELRLETGEKFRQAQGATRLAPLD